MALPVLYIVLLDNREVYVFCISLKLCYYLSF